MLIVEGKSDFTTLRGKHFTSFRLERFNQDVANVFLIVDHQHAHLSFA